jgi:thioredoxin-like negative regulator of GroEL
VWFCRWSNEDEFKDVYFAKFDVDAVPELTQELGIRAMPTFMVFKDGEKADDFLGANPPALRKMVEKHAA